MREMKDSGVEWIGEIPNDWELAPLRNFVTLHQHTGFKSDDPQLQFKAGHIIEKPHNGQYVKDDLSEYNHLEPNDIVINPLNLNYDFNSLRVAKADFPGYITNAYIVIHPNQQVINPTFLSYMLKSFDSEKVFHNMGRGVRKTLNFNELKAMRLPIPMQAIQTEIADYLDSKCSQIDFIVEKIRQEIEKLKEYQQSMITEAVTRGLDPDVEMKDSGIEWIGEVPSHWRFCQLRHIGKTQNGISKGGDYFGHGYPFVSYGDVYKNYVLPDTVSGLIESTPNEREQYSVERGDIFFTRTSETIEEVGFSSVCEKTIPDATFAGFLIRVRPINDRLSIGFSKYYFRSQHLRGYLVKEMNLVTRASLGQTLLKGMPVLIPPYQEQERIASFLDSKCSHIESAINIKQKIINYLQQYKKSLIYECVTGKKEVPFNA